VARAQVRRIGVIRRADTEDAARIADELRLWFAGRGIDTVVDEVRPDLDLLVILGGDGTLLQVASQAAACSIPVLGINLGALGFLTEVAKDERHAALEKILASPLRWEDRLMLKTRLRTADGTTDWQYALNDVVISKGNVDRLIELGAWAGDDYITTYRADGLIFSTPTGATAYNLSAGGPIVHPALHSVLVTPICPFMLDSRPVLVPADTRLVTSLTSDHSPDVKVIVDGRMAWDMRGNDRLEVRAAEHYLRLIGSTSKGYFDILRNKLNWGAGRRGPGPDGCGSPRGQDK